MKDYAIVSGAFTLWGGMERANYELARYLADEVNARVHLTAFDVHESLIARSNVKWHRVPKPLRSDVLAAPLLDWYGQRVAHQVSQQKGRVIVNGGNCHWPDVNWLHAVHAAWPCRAADAPAHFRGRAALEKWRARWQESRNLQAARLVLANSARTRRETIELLGLPPEKVHVVYLGNAIIEPTSQVERDAARQRLGWPAERPTVLFIGALGHDRNKGFDILFDAWAELCRVAAWDADLVACGGGAEVELWRRQAARAGLSARVRMLGFTNQVPDALAAADALVSPTHYESYGLGVQEALCSGLPAFVTRTAGVAERYPAHLQDLLLDAPPSVADVVARLRSWRDDMNGYRERVAAFGAELRQRTWRDMARKMVELIG